MNIDKSTKILIAEDEPISRKILHSMLSSFGFTNIYEAANGDEAIKLGRLHQPRFALLDIYMPQKDGWEVAKIFKNELPNALLIMITASREMTDIDESFSQDVDGYFFKPFQKELLLEKMEDLAEKRRLA